MSNELPKPKTDFDDDDYATMGMQGLDLYDLEELRFEVWEELNTQYQERDDGNYDLTGFREQSDVDVSRLEDAIWFLRCVDGVPIQISVTAFVGWFEE